MPNHLLSRHPRGVLIAAALCSALALSACGGSSNNHDTPSTPPPTGGTPPPSVADSFFAYVVSLVGGQPENTEPAVIDALTETKPENTEPEPVG